MSEVLIERGGDQLIVIAGHRWTDTIRQVPGLTYDRKADRWTAPLSPLAIVALWDLTDGGAEFHPEVTAYMVEQEQLLQQMEAAKRGDYNQYLLASGSTEGLWEQQVNGLAFNITGRRIIHADSMGSGKTVQILRSLDYLVDNHMEPYPALVVANKTALRPVWETEVERWNPDDTPVVVEGTIAQRRKALKYAREMDDAGEAVIVIISWDNLLSHSRLAPWPAVTLSDKEREEKELDEWAFRTVIVDEAHKAKEPTAKRTRALWNLAHKPDVENVWAMSGTPNTGAEEDVWALNHLIRPDWYPVRSKWLERYVLRTMSYAGYPVTLGFNPDTEAELMKWTQPFIIHRTKDEMIPNYQGKLPIRTVTVPMPAKQKKAYKQMKDDLLAFDDTGLALSANTPIEQLLRLNQFAAGTPVFDWVTRVDDDGREYEVLTVESLEAPSAKWDALNDLIDELGEEQAVVFAESRKLIDLIEKQLGKHRKDVTVGRITGAEESYQRTQVIEMFQAGELQLVLCTYGAAAESITLNSADVVIRLQRTYDMVKDSQSVDRVDRGERTSPVQIIDIVTEGTDEYRVHEAVAGKWELAERVIGGSL